MNNRRVACFVPQNVEHKLLSRPFLKFREQHLLYRDAARTLCGALLLLALRRPPLLHWTKPSG